MKFSEMNFPIENETVSVVVGNGIKLDVRTYLPIDEKAEFIQFVVNSAVDETTGTFSPLRVEVYWSLGLCRWYGGIELDITPSELSHAYDTLDCSGVIDAIAKAIPEREFTFMNELVRDTIDDIARYNNSFAGVMQMASKNSDELIAQADEMMKKVQNKEGLEELAVIKDIVG